MNITQLQRTIVEALDDVKAQDIRVFDTEHMTALFDRVIVASGTSNRQTKALAASVRDKVKQSGGYVVSVEGEDVGEWVLVDCSDAIVHIMQPAIRQYYHLEDIWGDKPVEVKTAAQEAAQRRRHAQAKTNDGVDAIEADDAGAASADAKKTSAKKTAAKKTSATKRASSAARKTAAASDSTPARKTARRPSGATASARTPTGAKQASSARPVAAKKSAKTVARKTAKTVATTARKKPARKTSSS